MLSLSKDATALALDISEWLLLACGAVLGIGIVGEYAKSAWWTKRLRWWQICVIAGVLGELLCDGGIFLFSRRLQTLEGADIQVLERKAEKALSDATEASRKANAASDEADVAKMDAGKAKDVASTAESLARGARQEADTFEARIVAAERKEKKLEERLAWRLVSREQHDLAVRLLSPYAASRIVINVEGQGEAEIGAFSNGIVAVFNDSHWLCTIGVAAIRIPPRIGLVCLIDDTSPAGKALVKALRDLPGAEITIGHVAHAVGVITIGSRPL
jgi:hypothetical protein